MRHKAVPQSFRGATPPHGPALKAAARTLADRLATLTMLIIATALIVVPLGVLASGPVLSASEATASAGDRIAVVGTGFARDDEGVLTWDGDPAGVANFRVNGAGRFRVALLIPANAALGRHEIAAVVGETQEAAVFVSVGSTGPTATPTPDPTAEPATPTPTVEPVVTPTPTAEVPTPTPTAEVPTPTPTAEVPTPTPTVEPVVTPTPTAEPATPTPTPTLTPAGAGPDPLTCVGYPEPRIFVESQSWWLRTPGALGTEFGHMHVGACLPYQQTIRGVIGIDVRIILHDNPGQFDYLNPVLVSNSQELSLAHDLTLHNLTCPIGTCTRWVHLDVDTGQITSDGMEEIRLRAYVDEPDGNIMHSSINTLANFQNGHPVSDLDRRAYQRGKGWYTGSGYCESDVLSNMPLGTVSGVWSPALQIVDHGAADDLPVTHHSVRLDPDFHAIPQVPGTILVDGSGPWAGSVAIDTTSLANGRHRLVLRADCDDPRGSTNSGVLVVFFTVAN